jgi:hypothetical protein
MVDFFRIPLLLLFIVFTKLKCSFGFYTRFELPNTLSRKCNAQLSLLQWFQSKQSVLSMYSLHAVHPPFSFEHDVVLGALTTIHCGSTFPKNDFGKPLLLFIDCFNKFNPRSETAHSWRSDAFKLASVAQLFEICWTMAGNSERVHV